MELAFMKIAVYGTGEVGEYVWRMSQKRKLPPVEIVYFVRSDKDRDSDRKSVV